MDASVTARAAGDGLFTTLIDLPGGALLADEPASVGGSGTGPTPYQLLSGALAACTSMTIRLYAGRHAMTLPAFKVEVEHALVPNGPIRDLFSRRILFAAPLPPSDEARLLDIADKCPVHRTLAGGGATIETTTGLIPPETALEPADPPAAHLEQMERASGEP